MNLKRPSTPQACTALLALCLLPFTLPAQPPSYGTPGTNVIVLENTLIRVMTDQPLSTKRSKPGTQVSFHVSEDVVVNHTVVIPRGAEVHGHVIQDKKAGIVSGSPALTLKLDSLDLGGTTYPLYTYQFKVLGESKTPPSSDSLIGGAAVGALTGAVISARQPNGPTVASNAEDISAGAAAGAGLVAAVAVAKPRPALNLPAEAQMDFYLASPLSVHLISAKEAQQLSQRLRPGGPVLYVHGETP